MKFYESGTMNNFNAYNSIEFANYLEAQGFKFNKKIFTNYGLLLFKQRKKLLGINIPFFYKLIINHYSAASDFITNSRLQSILTKYLNNPFCLRTQISSIPGFAPHSGNSLFNSLRFTYLLDTFHYSSAEDYFSKLDKETRYRIRKTENLISIKLGSDLVDDYSKLINENRERNKLKEYSIKTFQLGTTSFHPDVYKILVSYQGDVPLSGQIVFVSNNTLNLWGVSVSNYAKENKIYANEVVQYSIVKMAFDLGIRYIDWGGAAPYSSDNKIQSIDKFKSKWLGDLVSFPVNQKGYVI